MSEECFLNRITITEEPPSDAKIAKALMKKVIKKLNHIKWVVRNQEKYINYLHRVINKKDRGMAELRTLNKKMLGYRSEGYDFGKPWHQNIPDGFNPDGSIKFKTVLVPIPKYIERRDERVTLKVRIDECYSLCESCQSRTDGSPKPVQSYLDGIDEEVTGFEEDHQIATRVRLWYLAVQKAKMPMVWMDKALKVCLQEKLEEILGIGS